MVCAHWEWNWGMGEGVCTAGMKRMSVRAYVQSWMEMVNLRVCLHSRNGDGVWERLCAQQEYR